MKQINDPQAQNILFLTLRLHLCFFAVQLFKYGRNHAGSC